MTHMSMLLVSSGRLVWYIGQQIHRSDTQTHQTCLDLLVGFEEMDLEHKSTNPSLPALLPAPHISLWGGFHSLCTALLERSPTTLVVLTPWHLQYNLGFTFTAHSFTERPHTWPGLSGSPQLWRRTPQPFTHVSFVILKPEPYGQL